MPPIKFFGKESIRLLIKISPALIKQKLKRIFIGNTSLIISYFKFFEALPLALNISTKERAQIINPISSNKCKFIKFNLWLTILSLKQKSKQNKQDEMINFQLI